MIGTEQERIIEIQELYPKWEPCTLWTCFEKIVHRYPEAIFLIDELVSYTYGTVFEQSIAIAKSLLALGVETGDHIVVLLNNCPEAVAVLFALASIGAVRVPSNPALGRIELTHIINQSGAEWIVGEKILDEDMLAGCPRIHKVVVTGSDLLYQSETIIYWPEFLAMGDKVGADTWRRICDGCQAPDALSDILYTSGSTSMPKGVMMTHDMLLRTGYSACLARRIEIGRRMFVPLPLFHVYGYVEGLITLLMIGGTMIMSRLRFDARHALELMKVHKANDIICIANMMERIIKEGAPRAEDFPHMHAAFFSPTHPRWLWDACSKGFGIEDMVTAFGMTETTAAVTFTSPTDWHQVLHDHGRIKPAGCAARKESTARWIQIKICDPDTGEQVRDGALGEILCRGPVVSPGYYHAPELTAAAFDGEGWYRTSDLGIWEEETLTYVGRKDELYKVNGEKVSPQFVIDVIGRCPLVKAVEVVGVPYPRVGSVGVAYVEAADSSEETEKKIWTYCKKNLARFQVPKYIIFGDSSGWPKTASHKVHRKKLREMAEDQIKKETLKKGNIEKER